MGMPGRLVIHSAACFLKLSNIGLLAIANVVTYVHKVPLLI